MTLLLIQIDEFKDLEEALLDEEVSTIAFQVAEYFIRHFMSFDGATKFPDESFIKGIPDCDQLESYFKRFEIKTGFKWGYNPLVPSGMSSELNLDKVLYRQLIDSLKSRLPKSSNIQLVNKSREIINDRVSALERNIEKDFKFIESIYEKADFWRKQKHLYLLTSKIFTESLFHEGTFQINDFIFLKRICYFQSEGDNSDRLRNVRNIDNLRNDLNRTKDGHIEDAIKEYIADFKCLETIKHALNRKDRKKKAA